MTKSKTSNEEILMLTEMKIKLKTKKNNAKLKSTLFCRVSFYFYYLLCPVQFDFLRLVPVDGGIADPGRPITHKAKILDA